MADWEDRAGRRPVIQSNNQADNIGWMNTADGLGHGDFSPREIDSTLDPTQNNGMFGRRSAQNNYSSEIGADVWNVEEDSWEVDKANGSSPVSPASYDDKRDRNSSFRSPSHDQSVFDIAGPISQQ